MLRAKGLDLEVLQFLHKHNLFQEHEVNEFESLLRRARGLLSLIRNYGFQDPWGVDSLIEQAQTLLNEAHDTTSNLFHSMNRVGRTQQIDDLRMQRAFGQKDHHTAAKIAMRMLVEDEYIIDTTIVNALQFVNQYFNIEGIKIPTVNATQYLKRETRKSQVNVLREAKNVFFCLDYSGSMAGDRMKRANKNLLWVYHEHCSDKDMVGFIRFNHDIDDKLWFPLGKKGNWGEVQEAVLSLAKDAEGGTRLYAALNRCVTQILATETKNDTWIIALTDGESAWDHPAKRVVERIKNSNKQRSVKIHVIIIGFEVPESVVKTCEAVTSVTDKSLYVDARGGLDEMDKAFEQVVSVIGGSAITMETF
jgi:Mg-chelatase subunit ChlD